MTMDRPLAALALAGFVAAFAVHSLAVAGEDTSFLEPGVYGLHAGVFLVFVPFVLHLRFKVGRKVGLRELRALFPAPALAAMAGLMLYTLANFALVGSQMPAGTATRQAGRYVLTHRGEVLRELNAQEYAAVNTQAMRLFSGHWLLFYFVPFAYFALRREVPRPEGGG